MSQSKPNHDELYDLRKKAEDLLKQRQERKSSTEIEHELSVYEIELQMQNEELLQTQERLNASLMEYWELFELSPVGSFLLDKNGNIQRVNIRGALQVGGDKDEIVNKPFSRFLVAEADQDNFYRHMNLAIEGGALERMECEIKRKDGAAFFALIKSKVIKDEGHRFKHFLTMITDISQLKEHEHQIELELMRSEELNVMKSRFIGIASHEFRSPLTSMLSSTALIEQYLHSGEMEKIKRHLGRIKSSIRNLVAILDEFLSIEKLESGKVNIQNVKFNLPELCEDMIEEVSATRKKGQVINYSHFGNKEITSDKTVLCHILQNLLSNACKYSEEDKGIKMFTNVTAYEVTIIVEDQGIGIPEAEQGNVFTRFFRAQNTGNIQGTGLGLNIVNKYVELLGGIIGFVSRQNIGTTFTVRLPQI